MSELMIKDLNERKSKDRAAISDVRGGFILGAMMFQANQSLSIGGAGSQNIGDINVENTLTYALSIRYLLGPCGSFFCVVNFIDSFFS